MKLRHRAAGIEQPVQPVRAHHHIKLRIAVRQSAIEVRRAKRQARHPQVPFVEIRDVDFPSAPAQKLREHPLAARAVEHPCGSAPRQHPPERIMRPLPADHPWS